MHSLLAVLFTSLLAAFAAAQNSTLDPNSVPLSQRNAWCNAEQTNCPLLCGGLSFTGLNTCDGSSLNYQCTCNNGSSPDLAAYEDTLPSYICTQNKINCVLAHPNDANGQSACNTTYQCGTLAATNAPAGTSSSAMPSSTSASATVTSSSTATASTTAKSMALSFGQNYGAGIVAAGLMAALSVLL
ncbi:MAG: hypothetical protein FRX48_08206 [Lasallia pustulata]|uniref:DUF7707 domain-containing protein n=1 Tax=Lasallia pustulata TaxID=136370 RepID=A0A5M8PF50_9LECA|nr:MAG: hypothetical protein FRX48_08206 [Lasallia pustulata]